MVIISFLETELGSNAPASKRNQLIIMPWMTMQKMHHDTIFTIDSTMLGGAIVYDTIIDIQNPNRYMSRSRNSLDFLEKYYMNIPSAINHTFYSSGGTFNSFVNNSKIELKVAYTDHNFWEIFDFAYIEGYGYDQSTVAQGERVAVITQELAEDYFGRDQGGAR